MLGGPLSSQCPEPRDNPIYLTGTYPQLPHAAFTSGSNTLSALDKIPSSLIAIAA